MENNKMTEKLTMYNLYQRLKDIGFSKEFVKAIGLPSWWVDELDKSNIAVHEACLHISKRLCIELKNLLDPKQRLKFINTMTYEKVVELHRYNKKYTINNPVKEEGIEILSPDTLDYLEQVIDFKF